METSYNLAINELKQRKYELEREVCALIVERDKVLNEISSQRKGVTIVASEAVKKETEKISLMEQLEAISEQLDKSREDFLNITDKEKSYISTLERTIEEKKEIERQFIIKQEEVAKLEEIVSNKRAKIASLRDEEEVISSEIKTHRIAIFNEKNALIARENNIKEKEDYIFNQQMALDAKEVKLNLTEKRLDKLKEELLSKK